MPLKNLPNMAMRDFSATNARDGPATAMTTPRLGLGDTVATLGDGGGSVSGRDVNPLDMPNHLLVMRERRKLGGSATMARGAFMFSLTGLCAALAKKRVKHTW